MMQSLVNVFNEYIDLLKMTTNSVSLDYELELRPLIDRLESNNIFHKLILETRHAFTGYYPKENNKHSLDIAKESWDNRVKNFFRRASYYYDILLKNQFDFDSAFQRYVEAFQRNNITINYFAPMEYVNFAEDYMDFGEFQIRKFNKNNLDDIFLNRINKIFYPKAEIDIEQLKDYWFIYFTEQSSAPRLDGVSWKTEYNRVICHANLEFTDYPKEILPFLKLLSLFDWGAEALPIKYGKEIRDIEAGWLRFHIPFVYKIDDNLLDSPRVAPDLSVLHEEACFDESTQDVYFQPKTYINLNKEKTMLFTSFINRLQEKLINLEIEKNNWQFFDTSLNFFIKAFFSNGIEQLLWHITSIEAILGQREKLTENIANRIALILRKGNERKEIKKYFKETLYEFRSRLVHGKSFTEQVYIKHLWEARSLSRELILWFVHYLSKIQTEILFQAKEERVPTREDILLLIDLDKNKRNRLKRLLINLPDGFPYVEEWLT